MVILIMAMKILRLGDPILKEISKAITDINGDIHALVEEMLAALKEHKGLGLAAVQTGRPIRLFVTQVKNDGPRVFINPQIIETSVDLNVYEEGCLSVPGVYRDVVRPDAVTVNALISMANPSPSARATFWRG